MSWQIKICGITSPEDALAAADAGADAIGLNFYPDSKRYVKLPLACDIAQALPRGVMKVGVFVNSGVPVIRAVHETVGLDLIQLHGDEPPEFLLAIAESGMNVPLMRALPCGEDLSAVSPYLEHCRRLNCLPSRMLLDAVSSGQYGGTGTTCDWTTAAAYHALAGAPPLVLGGGLTPDNVAAAIAAVRPAAVDVASGVESSPGRKDAKMLRRFVTAARAAFGAR